MKRALPVRMGLQRKFILGAAGILAAVFCLSAALNSGIAERYYLRRQREYVAGIGEELRERLKSGEQPDEAVRAVESEGNVLIVYGKKEEDPDLLSGQLRDRFREKGLGFQKFWLWEGDYEAAQEGARFRLYRQERLNYSILVEYLTEGPFLYAAAAIVPDAGDVVRIINGLGAVLYGGAILLAVFLIWIFVKRVTKPLRQMEAFAERMAAGEYEPIRAETGDELEIVADSLNRMGLEIREYQERLEEKNRQMELLLNNVAHDLKTPISLVGMYARGIKDGMDDGTFLDTVIRQNEKMAGTVERLLCRSRIAAQEAPNVRLSLDQLLAQCVREQKILFEERNLSAALEIEEGLWMEGNPELLWEMFSNFLSNAGKYAVSGRVEVTLSREGENYRFAVSNLFEEGRVELSRIWDPFYVGEESRSQALSGTGLGLAIVREIAEKFGYSLDCRAEDGKIIFTVLFPIGG